VTTPLDILGLTASQLDAAAALALPSGRGVAKRLYGNLFRSGRFEPGAFGLGAEAETAWRSHFTADLLTVKTVVEEAGEFGTTAKAVLTTRDGYEIECVLIPMRTETVRKSGSPEVRKSEQPTNMDESFPTSGLPDFRTPDSDADSEVSYTLCLSSQVGCKMGCTFCETGRMGLIRHLTAAEIVAEVMTTRIALGWQCRNLVFMGMGEALDNADNLIQAIRVLTDQCGLHYSFERITVCTSGHAEGIAKLKAQNWKRINLSISLNASTDESRDRIMPVNRRTNLAALQAILADYPQRRNFTLGVNYCLMPGLNDTREDAARIAAFCAPLGRTLVNLIPYNPGNAPLTRAPSEDEVVQFVGWLRADGVAVRRRITKGRSIMAACGQLGNAELRKNKRSVSTPDSPPKGIS
jgi:23S rRNA (adenine2503-C2)-methyltransferase